MSRLLVAAVALVSLSPAVAQTPPPAFRVLIHDPGFSGCDTKGEAEAYRVHLAQRLSRPVSVCAADSAEAAAMALKGGQADMVVLDPPAFGPVKDSARAILAGRASADTGRVLSVALVLKTSGKTSLAVLANATPIVAWASPASSGVPLKALADAGGPVGSFKAPLVAGGDRPAFEALRAGRGDVLVVTAGARQRMCRADDPKSEPCADLTEVWRGRPTAPRALVVSTGMSDADRHQLVGIHIALHMEAPAAMAFVARALPSSVALDPTEAGALLTAVR